MVAYKGVRPDSAIPSTYPVAILSSSTGYIRRSGRRRRRRLLLLVLCQCRKLSCTVYYGWRGKLLLMGLPNEAVLLPWPKASEPQTARGSSADLLVLTLSRK